VIGRYRSGVCSAFYKFGSNWAMVLLSLFVGGDVVESDVCVDREVSFHVLVVLDIEFGVYEQVMC